MKAFTTILLFQLSTACVYSQVHFDVQGDPTNQDTVVRIKVNNAEGNNTVGLSVHSKTGFQAGIAGAFFGGNLGVYAVSTDGIAIYAQSESNDVIVGISPSDGIGVLGFSNDNKGVYGSSHTEIGVYGESDLSTGIYGYSDSEFGVKGESNTSTGVYGIGNGVGNVGVHGKSTRGDGVYGESTKSIGVYGESDESIGIYGTSTDSIAIKGFSLSNTAIYGNTRDSTGVHGQSKFSNGVFGVSENSNGVRGSSDNSFGVRGTSSNSHGAYFKGGDGMADIILGASFFTDVDDGVIMSEPSFLGSDIFLVANDAVVIDLDNDNTAETGNFLIRNGGDTVIFEVRETGEVFVMGSLEHSSDKNRKENITAINYSEILSLVNTMPIYSWQYKGKNRRHIGPMAQDFHTAFSLGQNDKTISSMDADGVALAAIKALYDKTEKQDSEIIALRGEIAELKSLLIAQVVGDDN